jgi:hypothetical protein
VSGGDTLVAIVGIVACLILVAGGLRWRRMGTGRTVVLGVIWAVIIAALALLFQRLAP